MRAPLEVPRCLPDPRPLSPRRTADEHRPGEHAKLRLASPAAHARPRRAHGSRAQDSPSAAAPEAAARTRRRPRTPSSPRPRAEASQPARRPAAGPGAVGGALGRRRRRRPARTTAGPAGGARLSPPVLVSPVRWRRLLYLYPTPRTRPRSHLKGPSSSPGPPNPENRDTEH